MYVCVYIPGISQLWRRWDTTGWWVSPSRTDIQRWTDRRWENTQTPILWWATESVRQWGKYTTPVLLCHPVIQTCTCTYLCIILVNFSLFLLIFFTCIYCVCCANCNLKLSVHQTWCIVNWRLKIGWKGRMDIEIAGLLCYAIAEILMFLLK